MTHKPKIALVDYSLGNLFSVSRAIDAAGGVPYLVSSRDKFKGADGIVVPGVGAFGDGIRNLDERGLGALILDEFGDGTPIMGICLGMQIMFESSEEFGEHRGLGIIKGRVKKFSSDELDGSRPLKVPHVGWHPVSLSSKTECLTLSKAAQKTIDGGYFYFVHSYYATQMADENILTTTSFGNLSYCSAVVQRNFLGFQFHPEKSGPLGLCIYKDWINNLGKEKPICR
jgi:glutamine amidotransferase